MASSFYDGGNETDYEALLNIKSMITQDPYEALSSWNNSLHFCNWRGVRCWGNRRVRWLVLTSQGLEGSLSPHVGNLTFLSRLYLGNNSFHGVIPLELNRLSRLLFLRLHQNKFSGVIPSNISACSKLQDLNLEKNKLVGSIPSEISFLSELASVSLEDNNLSGGIPPSIGNITSMMQFSVNGNPLGGSIPDTLGNWKHLRVFLGASCNLSGAIPDSLYNLSLLSKISLADNQLTGSLPPNIGTLLPRLLLLHLWGNKLTGPLPPFISNCSRLIDLELGDNKFNGKLTIDFAKIRHIEFIYLSHNNFGSYESDEMKFIESLSNCTRLKELSLSDCKFQGVLPNSIGNLSSTLDSLYLFRNHLHGNLPSSIGNLVGLSLLELDENQFIGSIPSTIGNFQKMQSISFSSNQISGKIPHTIGNLSLLLALDLSSNRLEGEIPSSLGNCHNLLELHLYSNKITGKIPKELLQLSSLSKILDISHNQLFGSLPTQVRELKMLTMLDLSHNNISGNIPSSLGDCSSLSVLFLCGNLFQGVIPSSLISLKALDVLDISDNNLSGQIPKSLELLKLEYLNLSYNDLEGEIPELGVFSNASSFSVLGNTRLCGGLIEFGFPRCEQTKKDTKVFQLLIIAILIAFTLFTIPCLAYAWCTKSKTRSSKSLVNKQFSRVSYNQLLKATNGFAEANLIGNGGFSSVYKGILDDNSDGYVAVKVLHLQNRGAQRSFERECEVLRSIRHRNLLKIITSCSSIDFQGNDFKALIYKFMSNGSLHDWLHPTSRLNILQVITILTDVASALNYIHNYSIPSIVHGDLKPSNILLDDGMVAHVGDFGLARFYGTSNHNSSTGIKGTVGYVAPEYGLGNEVTTSGDVYSFGIVLLEMLTGKRPFDNIFNEDLNLHTFASMALTDRVIDVIDINILNIYQEDDDMMQNWDASVRKIEECLAAIIKIGVSCTLHSPLERVKTEKILLELQRIQRALQNI